MRKMLFGVGIAMFSLAAGMSVETPATAQEIAYPGAAARFARETAKDYRLQARYPESSKALEKGAADPVKAKRMPTRQSMRGPEGEGPALGVWASAVAYQSPEPVDLFAQIEAASPVALQEVKGEISNIDGDLIASFVYRDDGRGADRRAGDGIYSARVALPAGTEPDFAESFQVTAVARLAGGELRQSVGGFLYGKPSARLTGRYRDEVRDGSLVIAAEVEVAEAGRFHLAGTVTSMAGEPIGTAQAALELQPGRRWIELAFYGLMFQDRKAAGPYRLGSIALTTATRMPNALSDLVENAYVTRGYRLEKMTQKAYGESHLTETANRLEGEAFLLDLQEARQ
ncbi:MAG TPA: choice-of-anchor X domain-containing protein [Thermoanaerobaculia bacterium]|nr:choice-of-anchor X domain-containing protein [Thermoanaerobaculia bacterium]